MIVELSDDAEADIEAIGDFITADSPARAETFVIDLRKACFQLAANPFAFPLLSRHQKSNVRMRVYGRYLIFYRVTGASVVVIRVMHGARDYEKLLFPAD